MFKAVVLGALYNLSDEALEPRDRGPADVHEIPGARASGPDAGRHDGVAVFDGEAEYYREVSEEDAVIWLVRIPADADQ